MPKGLKETSSLITIGFQAFEAIPNTFTQVQVDLQLNPLDNEVFVVYAIDIDVGPSDAIDSTNTSMSASVSTTSRTTLGDLADSNVLSVSKRQIRAAGFAPGGGGVGFSSGSSESPATQLDYLGIIATNNFFIQVEGANNLGTHGCEGKMYGVRARADASVFSALVQSELLSQ